jgi:hypothetical protein
MNKQKTYNIGDLMRWTGIRGTLPVFGLIIHKEVQLECDTQYRIEWYTKKQYMKEYYYEHELNEAMGNGSFTMQHIPQ